MKLTNTTRDKNFLFKCGNETFLLKNGRTEDVPEKFLDDPIYAMALQTGNIVCETVEEPEKPAEEIPEATEEPEEPKKTRKKKTEG